jgi:hypothetical protein
MKTNELKVNCEEKIFCTGLTRAVRADKNLLYRHDKPNEQTKRETLSFVLFESPFTSASTVFLGRTFPFAGNLCRK